MFFIVKNCHSLCNMMDFSSRTGETPIAKFKKQDSFLQTSVFP